MSHSSSPVRSSSVPVSPPTFSPDRQSSSQQSPHLPAYGNQSFLQFINALGTPLDYTDHHAGPLSASLSSGNESSSDALHNERMTSSLHAIHRPVRRARTLNYSGAESAMGALQSGLAAQHLKTPSSLTPDAALTPMQASSSSSTASADISRQLSEEEAYGAGHVWTEENVASEKVAPSTAAANDSVQHKASKRENRRTILATKLQEIFSLDTAEEVHAEFPCWLFRSVLLQGFLYVTQSRLCFFSYIPRKQGAVTRSGTLSKRASRTRRYSKYWFVLKDDVLSWYPSSSNPYFPSGSIDLHYATSIEESTNHPKHFRITTPDKTYRFSSEAAVNRNEWVKTLRKAVFRCQNEGESVKISIPFETVVDVDQSSSEELPNMIRVKVYEGEEGFYALDEFFFCYFSNSNESLEAIKSRISAFRTENSDSSTSRRPKTRDSRRIMQTTQSRSSSAKYTSGKEDLEPSSEVSPVYNSKHGNLSKDKRSAEELPESVPTGQTFTQYRRIPSDKSVTSLHEYPPPPSNQPQPLAASLLGASTGRESIKSLSSWLRSTSKLGSTTASIPGVRRITQTVSKPATSTENSNDYLSKSGHFFDEVPNAEGVRESSNADTAEKNAKLRLYFALPDAESVLLDVPAYLYRSLPIHGTVFVTQRYVCFRASNVIFKTTMILPIQDITALQRLHAFRFGFSTLIIVLNGHEELFFEFSSVTARNQFQKATQERMGFEFGLDKDEPNETPRGEREAFILRDLEPTPTETADNLLEKSTECSPVMFRSNTSTMIDFKPPKQLHFTCLTIGSRGDVQPYIALCKGLMLEGHNCRIVSHPEYQAWIQGHGIEFAAVGGDPAELMRICVENGTFTVAFFREGVTKFRGWLDELLMTSWEACQNTDVLIESPSAMAGIHIAEALKIPYFRAFTMPWTRTRTYPHGFGVPERKMGGSFNYMTYVLFETVHWRAMAGQVNKWRKNVLGLQPTTSEKMETHRIPFLYNFSPSVVPPPLDWFEWIHVTGYWFLENPDDSTRKKWEPPESLISFFNEAKAANKKLVYIGFGSIVVSDPEAMTRTVVEAVKEADVYAVVSKGWSDRLVTDNSPKEAKDAKAANEGREAEIMRSKHIYTIDAAPHDWLFARMDAACHHGGAGTTGASLRAGIPTVVKAFFGDQFFWAERVDALGVGTALKRFTTESLVKALKMATTDERQATRARLLGESIRNESGVEKAIQAIYRDLDYAKSLIKDDTKLSHSNEAQAPDVSSEILPQVSSSIFEEDYCRQNEREKDGGETAAHDGSPKRERERLSSPRKIISRSLSRPGATRSEGTGAISDDGSWDRISQDRDIENGFSPIGSSPSRIFETPVDSGDENEQSRRPSRLSFGESEAFDEAYSGITDEDDINLNNAVLPEDAFNSNVTRTVSPYVPTSMLSRLTMPIRAARESLDSVTSSATLSNLRGRSDAGQNSNNPEVPSSSHGTK